jgi:hypothetical protein
MQAAIQLKVKVSLEIFADLRNEWVPVYQIMLSSDCKHGRAAKNMEERSL